MTPRAGWKQPESGCTRSHFFVFSNLRIILPPCR